MPGALALEAQCLGALAPHVAKLSAKYAGLLARFLLALTACVAGPSAAEAAQGSALKVLVKVAALAQQLVHLHAARVTPSSTTTTPTGVLGVGPDLLPVPGVESPSLPVPCGVAPPMLDNTTTQPADR
eukprot:CAMPEP_0117653900 /NCGR_PEP_ID=MMETSP0804-20121206/3448_1 /TAXON_ID=1074897 /ORGANISM="Tetraselmis astigmatica, Strain CCMP880" /LENGTH=127 /DNA_ID=CAMNT_0005460127 /DNA_START=796 /DNA_END=1180 /DNA_ORIENTATION=+